MDFATLENQFKVLGSETRLRVLDVLLANTDGLRFSEIAKKLDIYPSTLEDHLKRLVETGFISHTNSLYRYNLNTEYAYQIAGSLARFCSSNYFSTHILVLDDDLLKERFLTLKCDGVFDILALMNKAKSVIDSGADSAKAGGAMNMELELSFFEFYPINLKGSNLEILFTKSLLEEFLKHEKKDIFLQGFDSSRTKVFIVEDCNFAVMTTAKFGALFLPTLDGEMDFSQALFFSDQIAVNWLNDLFDYTKSLGEELTPKEMREVWK